ncbi:MAG: peptidase M50 [Candidatus Thiodiazotropha sp.]|jgi:putative peptide zinc metalloprotease protein
MQNPNWEQIAGLRPQLRQHVETYPQDYRGERWYVLRDQSSGRHMRFNAIAYDFIASLDGDRSVHEIWQRISQESQGQGVSQDDILLILSQLFAIGVLRSGLPVDARELFKRHQQARRLRQKSALMNPLAIRLPLIDPDKLLNHLLPWVRRIFSRTGLVIWCVLVGLAGLLALANFPALAAAASSDILSPANLVLMVSVFIFIKAVHEFAHTLMVKLWGGEVHEMGITLLVLVPVPYVDASAAWAFRDKYKRALVGAVGIMAELFIAALALFLWLAVEPGLVRDAAFNAMLIGSVSTLLFNANPLLRFDGYYVLQDLFEIPNLYSRAGRYYLYLIQRYLFGIDQVSSPVCAAGERGWFIIYGASAFIYRLFIMVIIALFLAEKYLFLGVALALWSIFMQLLMPLYRGLHFLFSNPRLTGRRSRAGLISTLVVTGFAALLWLIPVSLTTHSEGVIWVPEQAQIFTETEGFVSELLKESGSRIKPGELIMRLRETTLEARIEVLEARYRELGVMKTADLLNHRVQSGIVAEEMETVRGELEMLRAQVSAFEVRSKVEGVLVLPHEQTLRGRYLHKGELIGYVISPERMIVRAVVPQSDIGLLRRQLSGVELRLAEQLGESLESRILRETPAASTNLPSRALGAAGGGVIAVRQSDDSGETAREKVFQIDLALPQGLTVAGLGERVYVRFDHGDEPLARQWLRSGRQLLLSRISL